MLVKTDNMGLGKTVQTICVLRHRTLLVTPTSTLPNWVTEIRKFRPRLKVSLYRRLDPKAEVIVTSYALLAALELLLRLRQAACHVGLVPGQTATRSSKLDLLLDHLVDVAANGHRALVFSQWTSLLDRFEPALAAHRLDFVRLGGKTQDREAVVTRFQAANGPPVMLLSLKAGGVGLNLTAADHVYLLDPSPRWWPPRSSALGSLRSETPPWSTLRRRPSSPRSSIATHRRPP